VAVTGTLDSEARRAAMAERLVREGALQLNHAAEEWGVHPMTIRRDFDTLVLSGIARRVRGGLVARGGDDFAERQYVQAGAKKVIADKLLPLIRADSAIALDSSTTVHALADALNGTPVSVVTNGLSAFQSLHGRDGVKAYLTGGEREEKNLSLVGSLAVLSVQQFTLDIAFLSTMSIDPVFGTSEITLEQLAVKQAMADAAETVVLAVDSSKFSTRARFRSLPLTRFDVLVTDLDPGDARLDTYRDAIPTIL